MSKIVSALGVSALLVTVAWGMTLSSPDERASACDTREDVIRHLDRSRNGISLTCGIYPKSTSGESK